MPAASSTAAIAWYADLSLANIDQVGGKNASLDEMVRNLTSAGVRVPDGFATIADRLRSRHQRRGVISGAVQRDR
jgi:pyruvate, water dikinase